MRPRSRFLNLAALLALAASASAQGVSFLVAEQHAIARDGRAALRLERRDPGALAPIVTPPWEEVGIDWLLVRLQGRQWNHDSLERLEHDGATLHVALAEPGIALVALDLAPRVERVPAERLRSFLEARLEPASLPADWRARTAAGELRVRRLESTKLLLRAGERLELLPHSATAQGKTGQASELRPLADPTFVLPDSDLPLRVYWPDGEGETRVLARPEDGEAAPAPFTTRGGMGHVTVTRPGVWIVEAHRAIALDDDDEADWELSTATLRFEVPPDAWEREER